jgi:hypothetical protein
MTALSLFDLLARADAAGQGDSARLARFGDRLVESALVDLERLRRDEQDVIAARAGSQGDGLDQEVLRSLWDLYAGWAQDAEHVLTRVRRLAADGHPMHDLNRLEDAYGAVRARLSVAPEDVLQAREAVRQGKAVPAKELRDELRARLRA